MPFEPLRFVHAANVFLDSPLGLSPAFDSLDESLQRAIEDATLSAFANVVDHCIDRDVDFLLLGGNTFVETEYSLPARIALRNAWQQLAEAGIRLYVLPGTFDPPEAWTRIPEMPGCVTVLNRADTEPLAVLRNGQLIAAIAMANPIDRDDPSQSGEATGPFRIGLGPLDVDGSPLKLDTVLPSRLPAGFSPYQQVARPNTARLAELLESNRLDYLAVAGIANRLLLRSDSGLIHHPGTTQKLLPGTTDAGGCTLVEVESRDDVRCTTLPTATVRFQTIKLATDQEESRNDLLQAMQAHLDRLEPRPAERVRVIEWKPDDEVSPSDVHELLSELPAHMPDESGVALVHHLAASPAGVPSGDEQTDDDELTDAYRRELHEFVESGGFDPHEAIHHIDGLSTTAADRLHALAGDMPASALTAIAERTGVERLRPTEG